MKVEFVYRNYIPLYSHYFSMQKESRPDIEIIIPPPKPHLKKLYALYRTFGGLPLVSNAVGFGQKILFKEGSDKTSDLYFLVGMLPSKKLTKPFIIDLEHIYALLNFSQNNPAMKKSILDVLEHDLCRAILPWSQAAANTIKRYLGDEFERVRSKVHVVYPAIDCYADNIENNEGNSKYVPNSSDTFNLLFVGRDSYRKGLEEVLIAFQAIHNKYPYLRLNIVSNCPEELKDTFSKNGSISFFEPKFSVDEVVRYFFLRSHAFIMPTKADTFGLVYLEALSSGLPVIATSQFALPEIVSHGQDGLLIFHPPLVMDKELFPTERRDIDYRSRGDLKDQIIEGLIDSIKQLCDDSEKRKKMGSMGLNKFRPGGKFSISTRNDQLSKIFTQSLA